MPLREDPTNPYRQLMFDMDDFAQQQLRGAVSPAQVADVVVAAATARRPRPRYFVPFSARVQSGAFGLLPTALSDRALKLVYKLVGTTKLKGRSEVIDWEFGKVYNRAWARYIAWARVRLEEGTVRVRARVDDAGTTINMAQITASDQFDPNRFHMDNGHLESSRS